MKPAHPNHKRTPGVLTINAKQLRNLPFPLHRYLGLGVGATGSLLVFQDEINHSQTGAVRYTSLKDPTDRVLLNW